MKVEITLYFKGTRKSIKLVEDVDSLDDVDFLVGDLIFDNVKYKVNEIPQN